MYLFNGWIASLKQNQIDYYIDEYNGLLDNYSKIFKLINNEYSPQKVLYPGSYCHITPSLFYPYVVYVDNYKKIRNFFTDDQVIAFIEKNKMYKEKAIMKFYFQDYKKDIEEESESFDLLISLNAGIISKACKKYLKNGGILLVNDEHYDARSAYLDKDFKLLAIFNDKSRNFSYSEDILLGFFKTRKGLEISQEMLNRSLKYSPSKDPFKLKLTSQFYLFVKEGKS